MLHSPAGSGGALEMDGLAAPALYVDLAVAVGTEEGVPLVMVAMAELTLAGRLPVKEEKAPVVMRCLFTNAVGSASCTA